MAASLLVVCARHGCSPAADELQAYAARLCKAAAYSDMELTVNEALQVCDTAQSAVAGWWIAMFAECKSGAHTVSDA